MRWVGSPLVDGCESTTRYRMVVLMLWDRDLCVRPKAKKGPTPEALPFSILVLARYSNYSPRR